MQDRSADVLSVEIEDFPNEDGWFMLWELSIADDRRSTRVVPVFVNDRLVAAAHRGQAHHGCLASARREAYRGDCFERRCRDVGPVGGAEPGLRLQRLQGPLERHERATKENHDKYAYALELRHEAARRVGIENIRAAKLARIEAERAEMEASYAKERSVCQSSGACCS